MHLTALVEHPNHVCCRYRLAAFRPLLEQAGHSLDLLALPKRWWSRVWLYRRLRDSSVVLQRRLLPAWELNFLRRQVRHLLFDLDDAVFLRDSYHRKGLHDPGRLSRFNAVVRASDAIVAGNSFLASQAEAAAPRRVQVIPTCVEVARYPVAAHAEKSTGVTLVWVGSSSTLQGLDAVRPMLEEVGRQVPGVRLKLICDRFLQFKHLPVIECPWSESTEAREIADADIGISWIPDDLWSRGKCGLKVLQYLAAGVPVVANPVGVHPEMIQSGGTGLLARTPAEWIAALRRLAEDAPLRRRCGAAGRRLVEQRYSVPAGATLWSSLLTSLARPQERCA